MQTHKKVLLSSAAIMGVLTAMTPAGASGPAYVETSQTSTNTSTASESNNDIAARLNLDASDPDIQKAISKLKEAAQSKGGGSSSSSSSSSESQSTTTSIPTLPNSDSNYKDDHLYWDYPIHVYAVGASGGVKGGTAYCLPARTRVIGLDSTFTAATTTTTTSSNKSNGSGSKKSDSDDSKSSTASNYLPVTFDTKGAFLYDAQDMSKIAAFQPQDPDNDSLMCSAAAKAQASSSAKASSSGSGQDDSSDVAPPLNVDENSRFFINSDDLPKAAVRRGWDFGTLVVPFKLQTSGKTSVQTSATLGGYLGYRFGWDMFGIKFSPIAFAGLSEIPTQQVQKNGKTASQTVAGISYGAGIVATVKDSFNVGLVVGADHVDSAQPYQFQDKPWVSLEIGYSFTK